jgi:hypothetical protein
MERNIFLRSLNFIITRLVSDFKLRVCTFFFPLIVFLGESWGNIFFTDAQTNTARSLADIKYLVEGPKKAVSAFLYFSKEIRDSLPRQDFARKSGELWKSLSEEQKAVSPILPIVLLTFWSSLTRNWRKKIKYDLPRRRASGPL